MRVTWLPSCILTCCLIVCASSASAGWQTEAVLPGGTFYAPSTAVGSDHIPHLAVTNHSNGYVQYLSRTNGVWQSELVANSWNWVQGSRGLRYGPDGRPRIMAGPYLFTQTGSGWNRSNALLEWSAGGTATAIDAQGVSRFCNTWWVSYTGSGGLSYDAQQIASFSGFPFMDTCHMEFTGNGKPNIVAMLTSGRPVTFYSVPESGGTWEAEELGPGLSPAMAIDAADRVHICYSTLDTNQLIYAARVAPGEWASEFIDESGHGTDPSMAVASNGRVCISYFDPDNGALKFASKGRGETAWHLATVDASDVVSGSSIAVDGTSIHIGYIDASDGLHYASALLATGIGSSPAFNGASIRAVPNPFNPSTSLEYTVPTRGRVRVTVFDAGGRVMERLVDAVRDAGSYRVQYRSRAASGVYFARVEVGGRSTTTKIVLLK